MLVRRILITGFDGFVGSHLCAYYRDIDDVQLTLIDISAGAELVDWTSNEGRQYERGYFDVVFHCAAFVGGRRGIDGSPAFMHTYNTMLDAALFSWSLRAEPGRIVYFSSSAAYPAGISTARQADVTGRFQERDISLDEPEPPEASYGLSKLHGEQMALSVRADVPVTILRPFSGYGSDQSLDYPFPSFIARAKAKADPFLVWGSGQQRRDWVHIDDLVNAAVLAAELEVDGPVNVCTGIGTSLDELAELCMAEAGYSAPIEHRDVGPSNGVDYRVGDPSRLNEFYVPKVTLREGVRRALAAA